MTVEIALALTAWLLAFLVGNLLGAGVLAASLGAIGVAWVLRRLWLMRRFGFGERVLAAICLAMFIALLYVDPLNIEQLIWYGITHNINFGGAAVISFILHSKSILIGFFSCMGGVYFIVTENARFNVSYIHYKYLYKTSRATILALAFACVAALPFLIHTLTYPTTHRLQTGDGVAAGIVFSGLVVVVLFGLSRLSKRLHKGYLTRLNLSEDGDIARAIRALSTSDNIAHASRELDARSEQVTQLAGHEFLKMRLVEEIGRADLKLGNLVSAQRNFDMALAFCQAQRPPDIARQSQLLQNIAHVAIKLGDWPAARASLRQIVDERRGYLGPRHPDNALALVELGRCEQRLGHLDIAGDCFSRALAIQRATLGKRSLETADTLDALGGLAAERGQLAEARAFLEEALALRLAIVGETHPDTASTQLGLSTVFHALGRRDDARAYLSRAMRVAVLEQGAALRAPAFGTAARFSSDAGAIEPAIHFGKLAVNEIQRQRGTLRDFAETQQHAFAASHEPTYRHLADLLVQAGRLGEAQRVLDLLKEEELAQFALRDSPQDQRLTLLQLTSRERDWSRHGDDIAGDLGALTAERDRLVADPHRDRAADERLEQVRSQLDAAKQQLDRWLDGLIDDLRQDRPDEQERIGSLNLDILETLQADIAELGDDVVLLHYLVSRDRLSIILTTATVQVSRHVIVAAPEINALVDRFRRALRSPRADTTDLLRLAQSLYRTLIAPIEDYLGGARVLMSVLDGVLRYVPLAALHDGAQFLVERFAFASVTPASYTRLKDRPADWNVQGIGGFGVSRAEGYEDLGAVTRELRSIVREQGESEGVFAGQRYIDAAFTAGSLADALGRFKAIHIASHFRFGAMTASASQLLLGDGSELSLENLRADRFRFRNIDLVTLSACETALDSDTDGGLREGLHRRDGREFESLGTTIQKRGAKAVIATLWSVEDQSTALIMKHFYQGRRDGLSKAQALRGAQLALLRSGTHALDRTGKPSHLSHAHPFFWAPSILMGNWL